MYFISLVVQLHFCLVSSKHQTEVKQNLDLACYRISVKKKNLSTCLTLAFKTLKFWIISLGNKMNQYCQCRWSNQQSCFQPNEEPCVVMNTFTRSWRRLKALRFSQRQTNPVWPLSHTENTYAQHVMITLTFCRKCWGYTSHIILGFVHPYMEE